MILSPTWAKIPSETKTSDPVSRLSETLVTVDGAEALGDERDGVSFVIGGSGLAPSVRLVSKSKPARQNPNKRPLGLGGKEGLKNVAVNGDVVGGTEFVEPAGFQFVLVIRGQGSAGFGEFFGAGR